MIQDTFFKPSLVNLISKDSNLVFYLSAYQVDLLFTLGNMRLKPIFCVNSTSFKTSLKKVQHHHDLMKAHAMTTFIRHRVTLQLI